MKIPLLKQEKNTCGPVALRMVLTDWGKNLTEEKLVKLTGKVGRYGIRTTKLSEAAKQLGFRTECLSYNNDTTWTLRVQVVG